MENNDTCKLLYNTERVTLHIPEYGRNVQKMVDYLKTIEDREKRNQQARAIIKVMEILNLRFIFRKIMNISSGITSTSLPVSILILMPHIRCRLRKAFMSVLSWFLSRRNL